MDRKPSLTALCWQASMLPGQNAHAAGHANVSVAPRRSPIRTCATGRDTPRPMELRRLPPAAPPIFTPPPPPPPPPAPAPPSEEGGLARRAVIGAGLVGGAALWWSYLNSQMPTVSTGKRGVSYIKTAGGNTVGVRMDREGRLYMFDRAGNLYYDTGDRRLGFYIVTADSKVYNIFLDGEGAEQRRYVGDIRDVRTFKVKDLGGVSVETLQKLSDGRFDGTITAFPDDHSDIPMPPGAPQYRRKDGKLQGPPMLEEGSIQLEQKKSFWPFSDASDFGGPLQRGDG